MTSPVPASPNRRRALAAMCGCTGSAALAPLLGTNGLRALAAAGGVAAATAVPAMAAELAAKMTPDGALQLLKEGNERFLKGQLPPEADSAKRRLEIAKSQSPFAVMVTCSDSRVSPELLFGRGLGDLFVIRVAGNTISTEGLGSIEYAVAELKVPLVVVMGHERCGAVGAALAVVKENASFPGAIGDMVEPILPAALSTRDQEGDWLDNAVRRNAINAVERLKVSGPLLQEPMAAGKLRIVAGRYDLDEGRVEFFEQA